VLDVIEASDVRRRRRVTRALGIVAAAGALALLAGCGEEEQGGLQAASPGPEATVGGEIDQFELLFDDLVESVEGEVTGPDGVAIDAGFVVDSQIRVLVELAAPLDQPGQYTVRSEVESAVGDQVSESYVFTFEPDAAPPQLVFPPEDDSGSSLLFWSLVAAGAAVILVLLSRLLISMRRMRTPPPDR
jgi:methionine-rich copper-binding protein CopC